MTYFLILFFALPAFCLEQIDHKLISYVEEFKLTVVRPPQPKRQKLFEIGNSLFFDKVLAGNENIRCIDCHHPRLNTQEGISLSLGEGATGLQFGLGKRKQGKARVLARNTPALFNLHNVNVMFWDGRVSFNPRFNRFTTPVPFTPEVAQTLKSALAAQAIFPIVDHDEMRGLVGSNPIANARDEHAAWDLIVKRVMSVIGYKEAFAEVYPGEVINIGHIGEALAEFQSQAFYYAETPYDRFILGDMEALTPLQKVGMDVFFGKGNCGMCHRGEHLSNLAFQSVGAPQIGPGKENGDDFGRYQWDNRKGFKYAFRVPPLRNVGLTPPYFHDGAYKTLEEVVEHYSDIQVSLESYRVADRLIDQLQNYLRPLKDHDQKTNTERLNHLSMSILPQLKLTDLEKEGLVKFLSEALTDERLLD